MCHPPYTRTIPSSWFLNNRYIYIDVIYFCLAASVWVHLFFSWSIFIWCCKLSHIFLPHFMCFRKSGIPLWCICDGKKLSPPGPIYVCSSMCLTCSWCKCVLEHTSHVCLVQVVSGWVTHRQNYSLECQFVTYGPKKPNQSFCLHPQVSPDGDWSLWLATLGCPRASE